LIGRHPVLMPSLSIAQVIAGDYAGPEFSPQFLRLFEAAVRNLRAWTNSPAILANVVDEPREQALESWNRNFTDTKRYLTIYRSAGIPTLSPGLSPGSPALTAVTAAAVPHRG